MEAEESGTDDEDGSINVSDDDDEPSRKLTDNQLKSLQQQVDDEVRFSEEKPTSGLVDGKSKVVKFNIENYINSLPQNMQQIDFEDNENDIFEDAIEDSVNERQPLAQEKSTDPSKTNIVDTKSSTVVNDSPKLENESQNARHSDDDNVSNNDDCFNENFDLKTSQGRFKVVEKLLSDARSHRSYSTSASTIAPSVIKDRIKKTIDTKEKRETRKRCVAKGEASAVTRVRNENKDVCKQYAGWDF